MSALRPIEIVGGGLAGLSLGHALQVAGVPVTLHEAGSYPRHRVCGEFITGLAPSTIATLGLGPLLADARHHREVAWFIDGTPARVQTLPSPALGLSRFALDQRLARAFVTAGGVLKMQSRQASLDDVPGRVVAVGRRRAKAGWMGLKFHVRGLTLARDLELHLGDQAYIGLAGVEDGAVNVCGLFKRRDLCAKGPDLLLGYLQAAGLRGLAARLAAGDIDGASCSAVAAVAFDRRVPRFARGAHIGDACAMVPPFTGNGMAMAFQGAETALGPLLNYANGATTWENACRSLHQGLQRRFRVRLASADALHPYLFEPRRQRWLSRLNRTHLLPLRSLYSLLH